MAMDFNKALSTKMEDVQRPPNPPIGHYVFQVAKVPAMTQKEGSDYQIVEFSVKGVSVFEDANDVDADELKAYGKVTNILTRKTFLFNTTDDAAFATTLFQLRTFLADHLQIEGAQEMSMNEALNASVNKRFVGELRHRPDKNNPEVVYAEVGRSAPVA